MESQLLCSSVSQDGTARRRIAIKPMDPSKQSFVLVLESGRMSQSSSNTGNINCTARFQPATSFDTRQFHPLLNFPIYGCVGLVQANNEPFVCVITDCNVLGTVEDGAHVYQINNVMFFSLTTDTFDNLADNGASYIHQRDLSAMQTQALDDPADQYETLKHPCHQIQRFFNSGSFYFSHDFDLTRRAQDRYSVAAVAAAQPPLLQPAAAAVSGTYATTPSVTMQNLWETADPRFFWNKHIIKELLRFRLQLPSAAQSVLDQDGILVMLTNGFVKIEEVPALNMKVVMISRLSCMRAGTRFNTRGIDDDGSVANNVETELLLYKGSDICISYTIVRGSVPVFWEQQGLQLGNHKIQITRSEAATQPAFDRHFYELVEQYGKQHIVNLLGQKEQSAELQLSQAFRRHYSTLAGAGDSVRMTDYDFHQMVKGNQYDNLQQLISELRNSITAFGLFAINRKSGQVLSTQEGTFRVNCLDCLDRTNVVQGLICKAALQQGLKQAVNIDSLYQQCLNDIWADNGDELSRIYTGTGALKSGFTRTGKRTLAGLMDDARKTATRFYVNNFQDKSKQEVMDLILGKLANQSEIRLHDPIKEAVVHSLNARFSEFASRTPLRVHVGTWNVNAKQPQSESLAPWLSFDGVEPPDVLVVGFQEIVELSPQQIMSTDTNKRRVWEELVLKTINNRPQQHANPFVTVRSGQLVGAALCVFALQSRVANIRNVDCAVKKTGLAGLAGNKGGVAIRMDLFDLSVCFVCAHLAAGQSNITERNQDYCTITDGLAFSKGRRIGSHDVVVWLGDFNYRIDGDNEEVRALVSRNELDRLFRADQLGEQIRQGRAFPGFREFPLKFHPTYKYDNNSTIYDSSEKNRVPAWTDRVLVSGGAVNILRYERAELMLSDHRPVKALIELDAPIINQASRDRIQKELYQKFTADPQALAQFQASITSSISGTGLQLPSSKSGISRSGSTLVPPQLYTASFAAKPVTPGDNGNAAAAAGSGMKFGKLIDFGSNDLPSSSTAASKPPVLPSVQSQQSSNNINWWDDFSSTSVAPAPAASFQQGESQQQSFSLRLPQLPPRVPSSQSIASPPVAQTAPATDRASVSATATTVAPAPQLPNRSLSNINNGVVSKPPSVAVNSSSSTASWTNLDLFQNISISQTPQQTQQQAPVVKPVVKPPHSSVQSTPTRMPSVVFANSTQPPPQQKQPPATDPFSDARFVVEDPFADPPLRIRGPPK